MEIKVIQHLLDASEKRAAEIRSLLSEKGVLMVNLIGSPGCGKTSLLEKTLAAIRERCRCAVIEGDVATDRDALRLQNYDIPICLINTEGACHLEPMSIRKAIDEIDLAAIDIIFVENVGNLVCPAEFDIGEHAKIAVASVPEGHDKPEKYPLLFNECEAVVLNKIDLLPFTDFDKAAFYASLKKLNAKVPVFETSCRKGEGLDAWVAWLESARSRVRGR
ncbi:MAG: hydrogenase nickel incorporation protein HypB [Chitinispirillaceae bacterium]|nr:hydrogenase nickel incorporation protein HypB [Chitinispirillaceae bacterium]